MSFLSEVERQTLTALCDTLVPCLEASPGDDPRLMALAAGAVGLSSAVESTLASALDPDGSAQLRQFLALLETRLFTGVAAGCWIPFSRLSLDGRTRVLCGLASHRVPVLRRAFAGVARLALSTFYSRRPGGSPNPAHELLGYDAPRPGIPARRITPWSVQPGRPVTCDVLVIGSGAGGGVAAAELSAAGRDVLVVEKGAHIADAGCDGLELESRTALFDGGGTVTTTDGSVLVLSGSTLGGGTTVNWFGSLRPPRDLLQEWERDYGFAGVSGPAFQHSLDAVSARMCIDPSRPDHPSVNTRVFEAGLHALDYDVGRVPMNAAACAADCGFCHFGCPSGARRGTLSTYLQDAYDRGARIMVRAQVDRVLHHYGEVRGAVVRFEDERGTTRESEVTCKAVVVAGGAIHTPAVLLRSGLHNPNIGRHLHLHPTAATSAVFADPIRAWQGAPMTRLSAEFANLDGRGYGVRLMNAPAHPGMLAFGTPWRSGRLHKQAMQRAVHTANIIAITRDRDAGRVTLDRAGRPRIRYSLSRYDARHLLKGVQEALRVHVAAGAISVHSPQSSRPSFRPAQDGSFDDYLRTVEQRGLRPHDVPVFSAHQLSSARIAGSRAQGVANPSGETYEIKRLFVADGSVLPTCSGVNPMLTILGTAHYLSQQIKARL